MTTAHLLDFSGAKNSISSKSPFLFVCLPKSVESRPKAGSKAIDAACTLQTTRLEGKRCRLRGGRSRLTARGSPQASASRPCRPSKPRRRTVVPIDTALGPLCSPAPILLLAPLHPMPPLHCRRRGAATGRREHHVPRSIPPPAWSAGKLALKKLTPCSR